MEGSPYVYQSYDHDSMDLDPNSPFFLEHVSRYWWAHKYIGDKKVLDCACGHGYGSYILSLKAKQVTGADLNEESLEVARKTFQNPNLDYIKQNVLELPQAKVKYDAIIAFEIIEHIPPEEAEQFLVSMKNSLTENGVVIISTPNHDVTMKSGVHVPDFHINNYKVSELRSFLMRHFHSVEMLGQFEQKKFPLSLLFDFDYFNLRHTLGKKVKGLLGRKPAQTHQNQEQNTNPPKINQEFFTTPPENLNSVIFSKGHWRQAGASVAICSNPRL